MNLVEIIFLKIINCNWTIQYYNKLINVRTNENKLKTWHYYDMYFIKNKTFYFNVLNKSISLIYELNYNYNYKIIIYKIIDYDHYINAFQQYHSY